ncbi:hypothetical protein Tco_0204538 [Tanacetum coccineum]
MPPRRFKEEYVKEDKEKLLPKLLKNMKRQELTQTILVDLDQQILEELLHQMCMDDRASVLDLKMSEERQMSFLYARSRVVSNLNTASNEIQRMESRIFGTLTLKGMTIEHTTIAPRTGFDVSRIGVQLKRKRLKSTFEDFPRESKEMLLLQSLRLCMMQSTWLEN